MSVVVRGSQILLAADDKLCMLGQDQGEKNSGV